MRKTHYRHWRVQYGATGGSGDWYPYWSISGTKADGQFLLREFNAWVVPLRTEKKAASWALNSAKNYIDSICDESNQRFQTQPSPRDVSKGFFRTPAIFPTAYRTRKSQA
jgi:hypothetical protein